MIEVEIKLKINDEICPRSRILEVLMKKGFRKNCDLAAGIRLSIVRYYDKLISESAAGGCRIRQIK